VNVDTTQEISSGCRCPISLIHSFRPTATLNCGTLCTINNPPLVRGFVVAERRALFSNGTLYESTAIREYAGGKQGGQIVMSSPSAGSPTTNHVPWCIAPATDPSKQAAVAKFLADNTSTASRPALPAALLGHLADADGTAHARMRSRCAAQSMRGRVFYYLDQVSKGSQPLRASTNAL